MIHQLVGSVLVKSIPHTTVSPGFPVISPDAGFNVPAAGGSTTPGRNVRVGPERAATSNTHCINRRIIISPRFLSKLAVQRNSYGVRASIGGERQLELNHRCWGGHREVENHLGRDRLPG